MGNKRIGIFDYRLDNFHANVYLDALRGPLADRGYQIVGAAALIEDASRDWCECKELPYFESFEALSEVSDYLMILAPSNPERHLEMCESAFPLGKPTFVDKTFAPDLSTAQKIFDLADRYSVAIQSTSALRSTNIQQRVGELDSQLQSISVYASGTSFEEYGIHPFELAISCMGADVTGMCRLGTADLHQYVLRYPEGRTAVVNFSQVSDVPFSATLLANNGCQHVEVETGQLFVDAAASILDFFDAGKALIDRNETLAVRHLLDLAESDIARGKFAEIDVKAVTKGAVSPPHWHSRQLQQDSVRQTKKSHS